MGKRKSKADWPIPNGDLIAALLVESDRGCVLVGAAVLDEQIKSLLKVWYATTENALYDLLDEVLDGKNMLVPYGTAGWGLKRAASVGLIKDTNIRKAIEKLNSLRNEFAHLAHRSELVQEDVVPIRDSLGGQGSDVKALIDAARNTKTHRSFSEPRIIFMGITVFLWSYVWKLIARLVNSLEEGLAKREAINASALALAKGILKQATSPASLD